MCGSTLPIPSNPSSFFFLLHTHWKANPRRWGDSGLEWRRLMLWFRPVNMRYHDNFNRNGKFYWFLLATLGFKYRIGLRPMHSFRLPAPWPSLSKISMHLSPTCVLQIVLPNKYAARYLPLWDSRIFIMFWYYIQGRGILICYRQWCQISLSGQLLDSRRVAAMISIC